MFLFPFLSHPLFPQTSISLVITWRTVLLLSFLPLHPFLILPLYIIFFVITLGHFYICLFFLYALLFPSFPEVPFPSLKLSGTFLLSFLSFLLFSHPLLTIFFLRRSLLLHPSPYLSLFPISDIPFYIPKPFPPSYLL